MHLAFVTCSDKANLTADDKILAAYLTEKNIIVTPAIWNDEKVNWLAYDAIILRSMWDYFEKQIEFNHWLNKIKAIGCVVLNPVSVVKWNQSKKYFLSLSMDGHLLPAYHYCLRNTRIDLKEIITDNGWEKAVVKPAVSAGSYNTWVTLLPLSLADNKKFNEMLLEGDVIVQIFMPEILIKGEISLMFFNKKYSHAIVKKPQAGDFRSQAKFGGIIENINPETEIIKLAEKIVNTIPEDLLYARVDGIIGDDDRFYLMELELIEPSLFVETSSKACENFYQALQQVLLLNYPASQI